MSKVRINLNEIIKVKLTKWGRQIYYHRFDRLNAITNREIAKPSYPKVDEDGYTEFQLWVFMELYGEYMKMTFPNVIEPLEIVYQEEVENYENKNIISSNNDHTCNCNINRMRKRV